MDTQVSHATKSIHRPKHRSSWYHELVELRVSPRRRLAPPAWPRLCVQLRRHGREPIRHIRRRADLYMQSTTYIIESMTYISKILFCIYVYIPADLIKQVSPVLGCCLVLATNLLAVQVGGEESRVLGVRHDLGLDGVGSIPIRRRHLSLLYYCCHVLVTMAMLLSCRRRVGQ